MLLIEEDVFESIHPLDQIYFEPMAYEDIRREG